MVLYPKNLHTAHDQASTLVTAMVREAEASRMKKLTDKLKDKYSFTYRGLQIVVPEAMQDIIDEGKALAHCVGGYAERHANGKLAILFIRKKSDLSTPFVTMEVRGKTVVQVHGYRNDVKNPLSTQVLKFVEEFKKYIENPDGYKKENMKVRKTA